jgi:hypothetical protein
MSEKPLDRAKGDAPGIAARDRDGRRLSASRRKEQEIRLILEELDPAWRQTRQFEADPVFSRLRGRNRARSEAASTGSPSAAVAAALIATREAFRSPRIPMDRPIAKIRLSTCLVLKTLPYPSAERKGFLSCTTGTRLQGASFVVPTESDDPGPQGAEHP